MSQHQQGLVLAKAGANSCALRGCELPILHETRRHSNKIKGLKRNRQFMEPAAIYGTLLPSHFTNTGSISNGQKWLSAD